MFQFASLSRWFKRAQMTTCCTGVLHLAERCRTAFTLNVCPEPLREGSKGSAEPQDVREETSGTQQIKVFA
jgi:hypothetical protein